MRRTMITTLALVLMSTGAMADQFGDHWYDGKAELSGYRLKANRYGEERAGTAVMIFVTEPFSESKRVKVDDDRKNPSDVVTVMKLNLVRDFQTGIYDYNVMTSVFSDVNTFEPLKVTFSSAEWCGHVYAELVYRDRITGYMASYFEDESGEIDLERPEGAMNGDNLFIQLRGLRGAYLEPGGTRKVKLLPSVIASRLKHRSLAYTDATISRASATEEVTVPAGRFETIRYNLIVSGHPNGQVWVESAYPHRIVRWEYYPDALGELTGSARLEYWRLNGEGDERYLEQIGLGGSASP